MRSGGAERDPLVGGYRAFRTYFDVLTSPLVQSTPVIGEHVTMGGHFIEDLEARTLLSAPVRLHAAGNQSNSRIVVANGIRSFISSDSKHGTELWRTDGRPQGTFMVRDITPGSNSSIIGGLTAF